MRWKDAVKVAKPITMGGGLDPRVKEEGCWVQKQEAENTEGKGRADAEERERRDNGGAIVGGGM